MHILSMLKVKTFVHFKMFVLFILMNTTFFIFNRLQNNLLRDINAKQELITIHKEEILSLKNKTISYIITDQEMIIKGDQYSLREYKEHLNDYKNTLYKYIDSSKVDSIFYMKDYYFTKLKKDIPDIKRNKKIRKHKRKGLFYTKKKYKKDVKIHLNQKNRYHIQELKINNLVLSNIDKETLKLEYKIAVEDFYLKKDIEVNRSKIISLIILYISINTLLLVLLSIDFNKIKKQLNIKKTFINTIIKKY